MSTVKRWYPRAVARRPHVEIFFAHEIVRPGGALEVRVVLRSNEPIAYDAVQVSVEGRARRYHKTTRSGNASRRVYHVAPVLEAREDLPAGSVDGQRELTVTFELPDELPPTYDSDWSDIGYLARAQVVIPGWLDARAERAFVVEVGDAAPASRQAVRVMSEPGEDDAIAIEVSLPQRDFGYADTVRGQLAIWSEPKHNVKWIELAVSSIETPRVDSRVGATVTGTSSSIELEVPPPGEPISFALPLHRDLGLAFETSLIEVSHALVVRAVRSLASDAELCVPIRLIRPGAPIVPAPRAGSVGLDRLRWVWRKEREALARIEDVEIRSFSFEERRVRFSVDGIPVTLALEDQRAGGHTTALIDYPDLGLGLELGMRSWTHFGGGIQLALHDDRFYASARDEAQAKSFLTAPVLAALGRADEVALDDAAVVLSLRALLRTRKSLGGALAVAVEATRALAAAYAGIAPPRGLEEGLARYRSFAAARGASLRVGDMTLTGFALRGAACGLAQRFSGKAVEGTTLRVALPPGVTPTAEQLGAVARKVGRAATHKGRDLEIAHEVVQDPEAVVELFTSVADEIARWSEPARGPYR